MVTSSDIVFEGPSYRIYSYTDSIYKVVHFKSPRSIYCFEVDRSRKGESTTKFDSSISRARKNVLELALCNDWKWFATFTLDKEKYDRYDLDKYFKDFSQWIRDQRKYYGCDIRYLLVPEQHADGAWHIHGLLSDIPDLVSFKSLWDSGLNVPWKLVEGGYYNWSRYVDKFGNCSLGAINDPVAVSFYIVKYISKSFVDDSGNRVGKHLYFCSKGLNRSSVHGEVYEYKVSELDAFCRNHYKFCDTGFTKTEDGLSWDFAMEHMEIQPLLPYPWEGLPECEPDVFEQDSFF